jgi:methyltransferase
MAEFGWIYGFLLLERVFETVIGRRNARWIRAKGGVEHDETFTRILILFHVAWFASFLLEGLAPPAGPLVDVTAIVGAVLVLQGLRYWCISSLGRFWNTGVFVLPGADVVRRGPYRFVAHPNYLVVLIEIPLYPLLFRCWATAVMFGVANVLMLRRRILKESQVLAEFTRT